MEKIKQIFESKRNTKSDINEHLDTLHLLSLECDHITEMGVRAIVSTYAFLYARPKYLIGIDLFHPSKYRGDLQTVIDLALDNDIEYEFRQANTLEIEIEPTDLLFIDTLHTYDQLIKELNLHGDKASKYIALHDTTLFAHTPERSKYTDTSVTQDKGLWDAVVEYLDNNKQWKLKNRYTHNNGLTVLERVCK